jgi:phage virion morphogenesis protein
MGIPKVIIDKQDMALIEADMKKLLASNANPGDVMKAISLRMRAMQVNHFRDQKDSQGTAWPALKPATIARRMKRAVKGSGTFQILVSTGDLRNSINQSSGRDFAITGTNKVYAAVHEFGFSERNIPQRQFIFLNREEADELRKFLNNKLIEKPLGLK